MERIFILAIIFCILIVPVVQAQSPEDISAIKQTALNYMDSWYKGDSKKMKQSLHEKTGKKKSAKIRRRQKTIETNISFRHGLVYQKWRW